MSLIDNKGVKGDANVFGPSTRVTGTWEEKWDRKGIKSSLLSTLHLRGLLHNYSGYTKDEVADMSLDKNCGSMSVWYFMAEMWWNKREGECK